jgi:hypothetical protein
MFFSPDGVYLAYDLPSSDAPSLRDIFVMSVDGSREIPAVVDPNQDLLLGWSPDGGQLLFASDRTGAIGLWTLPFRVGKPAGSARLVKPDIGSFETSMGLSASGALYLGITGTNRHRFGIRGLDSRRCYGALHHHRQPVSRLECRCQLVAGWPPTRLQFESRSDDSLC